MIVNVKVGESKTGRLAQNGIGGVSDYVCINGEYDIQLQSFGLNEKGDSAKVFNWVNYSRINVGSYFLLTREQCLERNAMNKKCNIPSDEDYQGVEEYHLTRTGRSTVKIKRIS